MTEQVKVVLDIHEPEVLYDILKDHPDVEDVLLSPLDAADISIGGVGFERKTWSDYVNSMKSGRLEDQVQKLDVYENAYILVEGDLADTETLTHTQMKPESIRGHSASLTAREENSVEGVVFCSNTTMLADYAVRLARKHTEEPTSEYLPTGAVGNDAPPGMMMWGCLSGVGPELAERIWDEFGSPMHLAYLIEEDFLWKIQEIDGVGEERAETIWKDLWGTP